MCKLPSNTIHHPGHLGTTGFYRNSAVTLVCRHILQIFQNMLSLKNIYIYILSLKVKYKALKWVDSSLGHEEQNPPSLVLTNKLFQ